MDTIVNNAGAIILALIGLLGTHVGMLVKMRSDQAKAEVCPAKKSKK